MKRVVFLFSGYIANFERVKEACVPSVGCLKHICFECVDSSSLIQILAIENIVKPFQLYIRYLSMSKYKPLNTEISELQLDSSSRNHIMFCTVTKKIYQAVNT